MVINEKQGDSCARGRFGSLLPELSSLAHHTNPLASSHPSQAELIVFSPKRGRGGVRGGERAGGRAQEKPDGEWREGETRTSAEDDHRESHEREVTIHIDTAVAAVFIVAEPGRGCFEPRPCDPAGLVPNRHARHKPPKPKAHYWAVCAELNLKHT